MEYGKVNFDDDWRFILDDSNEFCEEKFDDSAWRKLTLPHDWSIEGEYKRENPAIKLGGFLPGGVGWYRKHFQKPEGKRTVLRFDGVYRNSTVYVNGKHVGGHLYGFDTFEIDVTGFVNSGDNVVAVRVDNSLMPGCRWYAGCGIYRHVWIISKNDMGFEDVFVSQRHNEDGTVDINIEYKTYGIEVGKDNSSMNNIYITLTSPKGTVKKLCSSAEQSDNICIHINEPELWDINCGNLYTLSMALKDEKGATLDSKTIRIGLRKVEFTAKKGFIINGRREKIKGVCLHHDAGALGCAVPENILRKRIEILKGCGVNAIRTGHTPFAPEFYDMCDEMGIMVLDEMFDGWHKKAEYDYGGQGFEAYARRDLENFIKRDRNHPCVIGWSIGNETGDTDELHLTEFCHSVDPTRLVTGGQIINGVDIIGLNGPSETPGYAEQIFSDHPDKPVLFTEYPHCYQTRGFYRTQTWWRDYGRPRFDVPSYSVSEVFDDWQPEFTRVVLFNSSYDNATCRLSHKQAWLRVKQFDNVSGMFMWTGFDYIGESFGWPFRLGNYGIIDICGFPKDIYYFYQSQWTKEPMMHILPDWDLRGMEGRLIPVIAYTNCEEAELFLNGRSLGRQKREGQMELRWDVPYEEGVLSCVGVSKDGTVVRDTHVTSKNPAKIELEVQEDECLRDKNSVIPVVLRVTDSEGNFSARNESRIFIKVTGAATLKATDNGSPLDLEKSTSDSRCAFYGLAKAYLKPSGEDKPINMTCCAVLGDKFFKDKTLCTLAVSHRVIGGEQYELPYKLVYTTDGSDPLEFGRAYEGAFEIEKSCTVKAALIGESENIVFWDEFTKGDRKAVASKFKLPVSENVAGEWINGESRMVLLPNGRAEMYRDNVKVQEMSWWYEEPVDKFENDIGDIDNGEIQYPFDADKIKVMKDGTLRVRRRGSKDNSIFYKRK